MNFKKYQSLYIIISHFTIWTKALELDWGKFIYTQKQASFQSSSLNFIDILNSFFEVWFTKHNSVSFVLTSITSFDVKDKYVLTLLSYFWEWQYDLPSIDERKKHPWPILPPSIIYQLVPSKSYAFPTIILLIPKPTQIQSHYFRT